MHVRKIAASNSKADRFGAGGENQRAEVLAAPVREPDFSWPWDRSRPRGRRASARSTARGSMDPPSRIDEPEEIERT